MYDICRLQVAYDDERFWGCVEQKVKVSKTKGARTLQERALRGDIYLTEPEVFESVWLWREEAF